MCGPLHGWLNQFQQFQRKSGPQQIVLLPIQCSLNLLPRRRRHRTPGLLQPSQRRETQPSVLDKPLSHLLRQHPPSRNKGRRILLMPCPKLFVYNVWQHIFELLEAPCPGQLRNSLAELPPRRTLCRHLKELAFQPSHIDHDPSSFPPKFRAQTLSSIPSNQYSPLLQFLFCGPLGRLLSPASLVTAWISPFDLTDVEAVELASSVQLSTKPTNTYKTT